MAPDFQIIAAALHNQPTPRVPLYEHFVDDEIIEAIMGVRLSDPTVDPRAEERGRWRKRIAFYGEMGYDYLPMEIQPRLATVTGLLSEDTAEYSRGQRGWVDEHGGPIQTQADLENPAYWPRGEALGDFDLFADVCAMLPAGMQIIGGFSGGPFEHASFLMGLENLSMALIEEPAFVAQLFQQIGERLLEGASRLAQLAGIGAYRFGDDLGYKSATLVSPTLLREHVFPWYRRIVAAVHQAQKPFVLHSCGQLAAVMEDIIAAGVDAKHSFEDVITPVTEAKAIWGERIALLGGMDVHFLCMADEAAITERTKRTLDICTRHGGYAMGSGNTIANYVPVKHYLAMVEATREWNGR
jgi:uroporphyrinogen decarboxylase